jgi:FkbM family methyltransferase
MRYAFNRPAWVTEEENQCSFYSHFLSWDCLCFDIGANIGEKAHVFNLLGARVVCVEPVPACATILRNKFQKDRNTVVIQAAAGESPGSVNLHIGDSSTISSVLPHWIACNASLAGRQWLGIIPVPLITLDELIRQHGMPKFCKIDVEGYELQVLRGLNMALPALSFEWTPSTLPQVAECIARLELLADYEYNFTFAFPMQLEMPQWVKGPELIAAVNAQTTAGRNAHWGDIFARVRTIPHP